MWLNIWRPINLAAAQFCCVWARACLSADAILLLLLLLAALLIIRRLCCRGFWSATAAAAASASDVSIEFYLLLRVSERALCLLVCGLETAASV